MTCLWISGWGIPPRWFESQVRRCFTDGTHRVVIPGTESEVLEPHHDFDRLGGFSLGALVLLRAEGRVTSGRPTGLLAPFFAFPAEKNLGGRVRLAQLRVLRRWLERDPLGALEDFYRRAGLDDLRGRTELPYDRELLLQGIDLLVDGAARVGLPPGSVALAGETDALVDPIRLREHCPEIEVIKNRGHHPLPLLRALAKRWEATHWPADS